MFTYKLPNGGLKTLCYINANGNIKFDPPVYEQRYTTTIRILEDPRWGQKFKKVRLVIHQISICIRNVTFYAGGRFWMC